MNKWAYTGKGKGIRDRKGEGVRSRIKFIGIGLETDVSKVAFSCITPYYIQ